MPSNPIGIKEAVVMKCPVCKSPELRPDAIGKGSHLS